MASSRCRSGSGPLPKTPLFPTIEMRSSIQSLVASGQAFGTLLVGGAGPGTELPLLRSLGAGRAVLVEPVPASADRLEQLVDAGRNEQVVRAALVPEAAQSAALHLVNQPQHSSLREPEGLYSLFQGLKSTGSVPVEARVFADVIDGLELDPAQPNLLLLDVPGMTHELVASLDAERLTRFSTVLVRGTDEPLYAGDTEIGQTIAMIEAAGFAVADVDQDAIFPFRSVLLARKPGVLEAAARKAAAARLDELVAELESTRQAKAHLEKRAVQAENRNQQLEAQAVEAAAAQAARRSEADAREEELTLAWQTATYERDALGKAMSEAEGRIQGAFEALDERTAAATALEAALNALAAEKARLEGEKVALAAELGECAAARDQRLQERESALKRVETLTERIIAAERAQHALSVELAETAKARDLRLEERETALKRVEALAARLAEQEQVSESWKQQVITLRGRVSELSTAIADASDSAGLAVRLQTLRENDLAELQRRYVTLSTTHENQNALLEKLATRLVAANEYFQRLAHTAAVTDAGARATRTVAGPGAAPRLATTKAPARRVTAKAPARPAAAKAVPPTVEATDSAPVGRTAGRRATAKSAKGKGRGK